MKKYLFFLTILLFCGLYPIYGQSSSKYNCLPSNIKPETVAEADLNMNPQSKPKTVTVKQKLDKLKARCKNGVLRDKNKKEIKFYRLKGCWGNPPADYLEIIENQRKELEELKKKYTVIELTCNPSGIPIP
jgi:hypothetical protein